MRRSKGNPLHHSWRARIEPLLALWYQSQTATTRRGEVLAGVMESEGYFLPLNSFSASVSNTGDDDAVASCSNSIDERLPSTRMPKVKPTDVYIPKGYLQVDSVVFLIQRSKKVSLRCHKIMTLHSMLIS